MKHTWLILLMTAFLFAACGDEENSTCETSGCENGGTCVSGECDCQPGFSGKFCEVADVCTPACVAPRRCVAGACVCITPGYEGVDCDTPFSQKFINHYTVEEQCSNPTLGTFTRQYQVEIIAGTDPDKMKITNFGNNGSDVVANININSDGITFVLPAQTIGATQVSTTGGTGGLQSGDVIFNYKYDAGGAGEITCNAILEWF